MIARSICAFNAWPVAQTLFDGKQLRVWEARASDATGDGAPGTIVSTDGGLHVLCGRGALCLTRVQLAGARAIDATDFVNAHACIGRVLGAG